MAGLLITYLVVLVEFTPDDDVPQQICDCIQQNFTYIMRENVATVGLI